VLAAGALFIAVVVAKPWGGPVATQPVAVATTASASASAGPSTSGAAAPLPVSVLPETWPVTAVGDASVRGVEPRDPSASGRLASHAGSWGVAALGNGPRIVRDEPWVDWAPVLPERTTQAADRISTWPGTGICTGLPVVLDLPSVVAVTTPTDVVLDRPIEGWWSDGGRIAWLDGSIRVLSGVGSVGVTYLERVDGSTWPAGRYAFDIGRGDAIVSLVICLARTG
jgi:hypothetical protein